MELYSVNAARMQRAVAKHSSRLYNDVFGDMEDEEVLKYFRDLIKDLRSQEK